MRNARLFVLLVAAISMQIGGCPQLSNQNTATPLVSTPAEQGAAGTPATTTAPPANDGGTENTGSGGTENAESGDSGGTENAESGDSGGSGNSAESGGVDFDAHLSQQFSSCGVSPNADAWRAEILRLVNVERARVGLAAVTQNQTLENQATQYACEMIHYNFFAHVNPATNSRLEDRVQDFGYDYYMIGENLAAGQPSPQQAMSDWMASDGHRENILNATFTELGVGVRTGGTYHTYWVQEFGRPR